MREDQSIEDWIKSGGKIKKLGLKDVKNAFRKDKKEFDKNYKRSIKNYDDDYRRSKKEAPVNIGINKTKPGQN